MTQDNHSNQTHDDDAEGQILRVQPIVAPEPGFVVDTPHASEEDDAEGHISGARHVDPTVPSAAGDLHATHPKAAEDSEAF